MTTRSSYNASHNLKLDRRLFVRQVPIQAYDGERVLEKNIEHEMEELGLGLIHGEMVYGPGTRILTGLDHNS